MFLCRNNHKSMITSLLKTGKPNRNCPIGITYRTKAKLEYTQQKR